MGISADPNVSRARSALSRYGCLLLLSLAIGELLGHVGMRSRVPTKQEWQAAAAFVRAERADRDVIVAAPAWADPLLREALGDAIGFDQAGYSDLAGFERLWALSIRGHLPEDAPEAHPTFERSFGEVRVLRWDLGPSSVTYDFVDHLSEAEVSRGAGPDARACPLSTAPGRGGGLGAG
ncbi:MAG: hypothetical protein H5U40_11005, partial [Polyangiaceae bacterium]|nr:hypothetical protein [Polyangiaceae bacterium]